MNPKSHNTMTIIDTRGHKCPIPLLRLRRGLDDVQRGEIITLYATDPMTQLDVPHFCQEGGHVLLAIDQTEDIFHFQIKKAPDYDGNI